MDVDIFAVIYAKDKHEKNWQEKNEKEAKESLGESGEMGGSGQKMAVSCGKRSTQTFNPK